MASRSKKHHMELQGGRCKLCKKIVDIRRAHLHHICGRYGGTDRPRWGERCVLCAGCHNLVKPLQRKVSLNLPLTPVEVDRYLDFKDRGVLP